MSEGDLTKTGIKGLDAILLGGIPKSNVILVQGVTGSGKTLMGLQFIYRGIVEYNEPGLIVVFETSPDKLVRDAAGFGWNLDELQRRKKLQIIFTSPEVFATARNAAMSEIRISRPSFIRMPSSTNRASSRLIVTRVTPTR